MQGGKTTTAVASAKEAAANVGASAWSGKEKAQAVVVEKLAKARAHDPAEKAAADARMQERVHHAEAAKQDAMRDNAAAKERTTAAVHQPTLPSPPGRRVLEPEAGHVAGAPETGVVNDAPRAGTATDGYPTAT